MRSSISIVAGLLAGSALNLGGCATDSADSEDPEFATGNPGAWTATEVTDANIDKALVELPEIVTQMLTDSGVPGASVALVRSGDKVFAEGFGVRQAGDDAGVDPDTVFQIASLSKPVGATVVSRSVSDGVVGWEDPIRADLPNFRLKGAYPSAQVTISDMYAHRSGLPSHAGDQLEDLG